MSQSSLGGVMIRHARGVKAGWPPSPMYLHFKALLSYLTDLFKFEGQKEQRYKSVVPQGLISMPSCL